MFNADEETLLDSTARFYEDRQACQALFDLTRLGKDVRIGPEAFRRAFDQLSILIPENTPDKWPSLSGGYYDLISYARSLPDLCLELGQSGSLIDTFTRAAQQAISHDKLVICVTLMETAMTEPSRTWRGILAQPDGIAQNFARAAGALRSYDGRIAAEFFRLADGEKAWSMSLAASGVLVRVIDACPHQAPMALDILQKSAANPVLRDGIIKSGSLRQIYNHVREWRNIVPFQLQCVDPWARALFPSLPPEPEKAPARAVPFEMAANLG